MGRAAPTRTPARVVAARPWGPWDVLALAAPGVPPARPGQLALLGPVHAPEPLVPAAGWVHGSGAHGGAIEVVADRERSRNSWLRALQPGDPLQVLAPVGRPLPLPRGSVHALLAAAGPTSAAMVWLSALLRERGCRTTLVLAAPDVERLPEVSEARACADEVILAVESDPGSDAARTLSRLAGTSDAVVAYLSGPLGRLGGWVDIVERAGMTAQVLVDSLPLCGTGLCGSCAVPLLSGGDVSPARACVEGPALPGARVAWDMLQEPEP